MPEEMITVADFVFGTSILSVFFLTDIIMGLLSLRIRDFGFLSFDVWNDNRAEMRLYFVKYYGSVLLILLFFFCTVVL